MHAAHNTVNTSSQHEIGFVFCEGTAVKCMSADYSERHRDLKGLHYFVSAAPCPL